MEYVNAKQLKNEFKVIASFYNQQVNGEVFQCRSQAIIFRNHITMNHDVDAVLFVMNPGSSAPIRNEFSIPTFHLEIPKKLSFEEAKPDQTQYQVMRLMKLMRWQSVLIVNLSDDSVINSCKGPLLIAWGTNNILRSLANIAISRLPLERIKGLQYLDKPFYYHINPILKEKQLEVLSRMREII